MMSASRPQSAAVLHDFFRRQGYLYVPGLFPVQQCRDVLAEFAAAVPEARPAAASGRFWRTDAAHARLAAAERLLHSEGVLGLLRSVLGPNVALVTNRHDHITVNAGLGKAGRLHRDILHWSRNLVSLIVYVNVPAGLELGNGTAVLPGSHLLHTIGRANNGGTWLDESPHAALADQAVSVPAEVGAVLLMDGMTYHAAQIRLADDAREIAQARVAISWACRAVDELHHHDLDAPVRLLTGEPIYRGNDRHVFNRASDRLQVG